MPPVIIGIGIGGSAETAMLAAKRACLRPITEQSNMEKSILEAVNKLGVGPMGLGGATTALAVNIDYVNRHPATFPLAIAMQCWAARRICVEFDSDGSGRFLELGEEELGDGDSAERELRERELREHDVGARELTERDSAERELGEREAEE